MEGGCCHQHRSYNRDEECPICMREQKENTIRLRCGHVFHRECAYKWIRRSPTCPLCRKEVCQTTVENAKDDDEEWLPEEDDVDDVLGQPARQRWRTIARRAAADRAAERWAFIRTIHNLVDHLFVSTTAH